MESDSESLAKDICATTPSNVTEGGTPTFSELEITGILHDGAMEDGMPRGAYGAVFFDGDGNLFFGLNNGDHDLDQSTSNQGGI